MDFYEVKITNKTGTIHTPCNVQLDISHDEIAEVACQLIAEFACEISAIDDYDEFLTDVRLIFKFINRLEEGALELNSSIVTIHKKHND